MPGLSFQSQNNRASFSGGTTRRPGGWIIALVLVIISVALITLCVRSEGAGPFSAIRAGVQTVTKPIERAVANVPSPLRSIGNGSSEEVDQLKQENEQLRSIVAELEEYRQQNQRLSALVQIADTYDLATKSTTVTGVTSGWSRTATIGLGSDDGIRIGMGVISSSGLYGQVESVTAHASTVRLITDSNSSVSAMVQGSRARGILHGSYDGVLTMEYVSTEYTVGEGDYVITSGDGGAYPNGIIIGTVKDVEPDPSKLYYRITVDPIFRLASCQEVMVLTGDEGEVASILDEDMLKNIKDAMIATDSKTATAAVNTARTGTTETFSAQSGDAAQSENANTQNASNSTADQSKQSSEAGQAASADNAASSDAEQDSGKNAASDSDDKAKDEQ